MKTRPKLQWVESASGSAACRKGGKEQKWNPITEHQTNTLVDQCTAHILGQAKSPKCVTNGRGEFYTTGQKFMTAKTS